LYRITRQESGGRHGEGSDAQQQRKEEAEAGQEQGKRHRRQPGQARHLVQEPIRQEALAGVASPRVREFKRRRLAALGQKQTSDRRRLMSALPKADMVQDGCDVRLVPQADIWSFCRHRVPAAGTAFSHQCSQRGNGPAVLIEIRGCEPSFYDFADLRPLVVKD
jgi:hypothetical protein